MAVCWVDPGCIIYVVEDGEILIDPPVVDESASCIRGSVQVPFLRVGVEVSAYQDVGGRGYGGCFEFWSFLGSFIEAANRRAVDIDNFEGLGLCVIFGFLRVAFERDGRFYI